MKYLPLQQRFFRCPCMSLRFGGPDTWVILSCTPNRPTVSYHITENKRKKKKKKKKKKRGGKGRRGNASPQTPRFCKTPLDISRFGLFENRRLSTFAKFTLISLKHAPPSFLSTPSPNSSFCSRPNFSKLSRRTREEMLATSFLLSWKLASLVRRNTNKVIAQVS